MLELRNLTKVYKTKSEDVFALNNVNLSFGETGMIFITGKSGSGKTTLLNVIGGLDSFNEGDLLIKGKSFSQFKQSDFDNYRNTFIGFVFQEYNLLEEMTVEKNISLAIELQGQRRRDVERINDILKRVDLEGMNDRHPSELSGGQKQRVAIARALIKNPQIILTDEPTGALDTNSGIQVMDLLMELSRERLVIIVSHNMELARTYADRIIEMKDGSIQKDYTLTRGEESDKLHIKELDDKVIVKRGAKLEEEDLKLLQQSVEHEKDVEIVDKSNFYIERETEVEPKQYEEGAAKFIKGNLGLGNTLKMGFSNLKIKPLRLIITILLCAIAFSVFGLFDALTINDDSRLTTNTLKNTNVPCLVMTSTYLEDNGDENRFSLSQGLIDELNSDTDMTFKGVYNISSIRPDEVRTAANISKYYLTAKMSGVIEVEGEDELSNLGLKMAAGRLPSAYDEIAIPEYYAMCIINYGYSYEGFVINEQNCKDITPADLIDDDNPLVITLNKTQYKIVGIVDAGKIDGKYDGVLADYANAEESLKTEFENYVGNSYHLYGFVKDGFIENYNLVNKTPLQYKNASYSFDFDVIAKDSQYFFKYDDVKSMGESTVMFVDEGKETLEGNEVLLNVQLFESVYEDTITRFKAIATGKRNDADIEMLNTHLQNLLTTKTTDEEKLAAVRSAIELMCSPGYNIKIKAFTVDTTVTKRDTTKYNADGSDLMEVDLTDNKYTVVGFYTGLALNLDKNAPVLTESGMTNLGINIRQGEYSSVIALSPVSNSQISKVVSLVTGKDGLKYTSSNNIISIVTLNRDTLKDISDLFLIASAIFAAFAIVMMANYIAVTITNRHTQIGILRAIGTPRWGILVMFLVGSVIIALINIALSNVITAVASIYLNGYFANVMNINIPLAYYTVRQFWVIGGLSLAVALVSSLLPIFNLSRKKPIETIRK